MIPGSVHHRLLDIIGRQPQSLLAALAGVVDQPQALFAALHYLQQQGSITLSADGDGLDIALTVAGRRLLEAAASAPAARSATRPENRALVVSRRPATARRSAFVRPRQLLGARLRRVLKTPLDADYGLWNDAIIRYLLSGTPQRQAIYLTIDEDALLDIGQHFLGRSYGSASEVRLAFVSAVRRQCVSGDEVLLGELQGLGEDGQPRCAAFLAALVLAAHDMIAEDSDEDSIREYNYFTRLRQLLRISDAERGRPAGLESGKSAEEPLWAIWNHWLECHGWLASATPGDSPSKRYVHYALSQALLRKGDRERLEDLYYRAWKQGVLHTVLDRQSLGHWLGWSAQKLPNQRLRRAFGSEEGARLLAFVDAAFELYNTSDWQTRTPGSARAAASGPRQRRLLCGLYRVENLFNDIEYLIYPEQPRRMRHAALSLLDGPAGDTPLIEERPGWFRPLFAADFTSSQTWRLDGDSDVQELVLPERDFWLLVADPDDEDSGVWANWEAPGLGQQFLLLCKEHHLGYLRRLREEGLLLWEGAPLQGEATPADWIELHRCMVPTRNLDAVVVPPGCEGLRQALVPLLRSRILLRGGIHVPGSSAWIEQHLPELRIVALPSKVDFELIHWRGDSCSPLVERQEVHSNVPVPLPDLEPGDYEIHAWAARGGPLLARRTLSIRGWDDLQAAPVLRSIKKKLPGLAICGARLELSAEE